MPPALVEAHRLGWHRSAFEFLDGPAVALRIGEESGYRYTQGWLG
jgi:hypothetical protein